MEDSNVDRVKKLFAYLSELSDLKKKPVSNYRNHRGVIKIDSDVKDNHFVDLLPRDEHNGGEEGSPLLMVRYPTKTPKPPAPSILDPYLAKGMRVDGNTLVTAQGDPAEIPHRPEIQVEIDRWVKDLEAWKKTRSEERSAQALFDKLMDMRRQFQRDVEPLELLAANIVASSSGTSTDRPIFVKRVTVEYDDASNAMVISDTAEPTGIHSAHLTGIGGLDLSEIRRYESEVSDPSFHPFDPTRTKEVGARFLHSCSPSAVLLEEGSSPVKWSDRPLVGHPSPMFLLRRKPDGIGALAERVRETLEDTEEIPAHLLHLVGIEHERTQPEPAEPSLEQRLAYVGGEDSDILLAKLANGEQLDIAREIERHSAVIVQGPPGTGKTHTIANLVGHFLAQGKTVLVTSEKNKALSVLKDKLDPQIQSLCVSLVGDSTADLRRSVAEISSRIANGVSRQKANAKRLEEEREEAIGSISKVRRALFASLDAEQSTIAIDDEEIFPIDAARFVEQNRAVIDCFGFTSRETDPYPFAENEIETLYQLNLEFEDDFRSAADGGFPDPSKLLSPRDFKEHISQATEYRKILDCSLAGTSVSATTDKNGRVVSFSCNDVTAKAPTSNAEELERLISAIDAVSLESPWERALVVAGTDDVTVDNWFLLFEKADEANRLLSKNIELFSAHEVEVSDGLDPDFALDVLEEAKDELGLKGLKLMVKRMTNKESILRRDRVLSSVKVDGRPIATQEDLALAQRHLELILANKKVITIWNNLIQELGAPDAPIIDPNRPDRTVRNHQGKIEQLLKWGRSDFPSLVEQAAALGLPARTLVQTQLAGDISDSLDRAVACLKGPIRTMALASVASIGIQHHEEAILRLLDDLDGFSSNRFVRELQEAAERHDTEAYTSRFEELQSAYACLGTWETYRKLLSHVELVSPHLGEQHREEDPSPRFQRSARRCPTRLEGQSNSLRAQAHRLDPLRGAPGEGSRPQQEVPRTDLRPCGNPSLDSPPRPHCRQQRPPAGTLRMGPDDEEARQGHRKTGGRIRAAGSHPHGPQPR